MNRAQRRKWQSQKNNPAAGLMKLRDQLLEIKKVVDAEVERVRPLVEAAKAQAAEKTDG